MTDKPTTGDDGYIPGRKYVVPVAPLDPATEQVDRHLAILTWEPRIEEWVTGMGLCGRSTAQGPATEEGVCCPDCITILDSRPRRPIEQGNPVVTENPTISPDPGSPDHVLLHLPDISYWDTQVWSADVGLRADALPALRDAIDSELARRGVEDPRAATATVKYGDNPCIWCGNPVPQKGIGRPRDYCRQSCRQRAHEARKHLRGVADALGLNTPADDNDAASEESTDAP